MTLSVKSRLEARIKYGHHMPFTKLMNIIKSISIHAIYIDFGKSGTLASYLNPQRFPKEVVVVNITERHNQIWSMGKEILATIVEIEEF